MSEQTNLVAAESASAAQRDQAFQVLSTSTIALTTDNQAYPTASQVRLEMKRRTYGGFDPKGMGYTRFRDFLEDAANQGHVKLDGSRQGDILVLPPHVASALEIQVPIRRDVWKAFVDWTPDRLRYFDLEKQRVVVIPSHPVPLEPARFAEIREHQSQRPDEFVEILPITVHKQTTWMSEWAATVPSRQFRTILETALSDSRPIKTFNLALKSFPSSYSAEWRRVFEQKVRAEIEHWAATAPAGVSILRESAAGLASSEDASANPIEIPPSAIPMHGNPQFAVSWPSLSPLATSAWHINVIGGSTNDVHRKLPDPESDLRNRVHAAIDRMSIDEIRKLSIPVGYLFED